MNLFELGEDRLVARLIRRLPCGSNLLVGPGDDCAVLGRRRDPFWTLLKTDCVIEGIHFTPETDPRRVGWKAMARAVSDIAAMGGEPETALITVALSPTTEVEWVEALYAGLVRCARKFHIAIAGGETARSPGPAFISVMLTGRVEKNQCTTRSGGRPGDLLYVTGRLGGSLAGKHLDFIPRLKEARWLTGHFRVRAMMDLSDGLGADLPRLAAASGCGFELGEVPCVPGGTREAALGDGEDFELLLAVSPRDAARLERDWPFRRLPLTRIGRLTEVSHGALPVHGYDHFTQSRADL